MSTPDSLINHKQATSHPYIKYICSVALGLSLLLQSCGIQKYYLEQKETIQGLRETNSKLARALSLYQKDYKITNTPRINKEYISFSIHVDSSIYHIYHRMQNDIMAIGIDIYEEERYIGELTLTMQGSDFKNIALVQDGQEIQREIGKYNTQISRLFDVRHIVTYKNLIDVAKNKYILFKD